MAIYPTREQIQKPLDHPSDAPVAIVNRLRFRERATAPDEGMSGSEAHALYGDRMRRIVERHAEIGIHRTAGLESQWLVATTPGEI